MVFDWRSHRYLGGSGWRQPALVVVLVGVISEVALLPDPILITSLSAAVPVRSLSSDQAERTLAAAVPVRTLTFDG